MRSRALVHVTIAVCVLSVTGGLAADSSWTIPGIVHADGLNGTHFVSDLTATNPGTSPAHVTLSFFPAPAALSKVLTLDPGQSIVAPDVLAVHFGLTGAGALSIVSDQPLLIRARTYNAAASGTFGVALPVVPTERLLAPGDVADSLWVTQDPSPASGYRTNVALVFPDPSGGAATVTVYDADGNARGSQDYTLSAAGLQQFPVGSIAGAVSVGRAQVVVTRGHAAGYSVVVDNVTGDSSLFAFEDLPAGMQDVLANGVARANGRNGAFFRTDGRFYNPTDTDATVQVSYLAAGNANPSPQTASFVLAPGRIRDVVDVLGTLLGLPVGSAGALRFRSDRPVAILCRTSNVDPTGARPGTFGSQQKPAPLFSFLTSADAGAAVTGIRQDASYRTNVGFAAGADGAQVALTLQDASGVVVATSSASLGAFGWTQPGVQDLFPSVTIPSNATLRVRVTGGSVDVFDSSIDNLSGDGVVTPIAALPVTIPSSTTIGPAGGSVASQDGRLTLRVPAGALASPVSLSFTTDASNDAPQATGPSYTLSPGGLAFSKPAALVFRYGPTDLFGTAAGALGIAFQNGTTWYVVTGGSIDPASRTLTVRIGSTSPAVTTAPAALRADPITPRRFTAFRSIQIFPKKAAVLVEGSLNLVVIDVGDASATPPWLEGVAPGGVSPLSPVDPSNITYTWSLNGLTTENAANGLLTQSGTNTARYLAPSCTPRWNPVIIRVDIGLRSNPNPHFTKSASCIVRVLPRDWQLKANLDEKFGCPLWFANDHVTYGADVRFSLDDRLNVANVQPVVTRKEFIGNPTACESENVDVQRQAGDQLFCFIDGGFFDVEKDQFDLVMQWFFPGSPGYDYNMLGSDGKKYPGHWSPGPTITVPDLDYFLSDGQRVSSLPFPLALEFTFEYRLDHVTPGCP